LQQAARLVRRAFEGLRPRNLKGPVGVTNAAGFVEKLDEKLA
jgi:hypothetical protein